MLTSANRREDARLLLETTLKLDPKNPAIKALVEKLRQE
jgi:hypothetical protein